MLEKKILPILKYIGFIGSVITSVAYIALIIVLIQGFKVNEDITQQITFSVITTIVGLIILELLKVQGISLAKGLEENKDTLNKYYGSKTKDKKNHSLKHYYITSTIADVAIKGLSFVVTTFGIIYICIQGSNDYSLLLLGIVNLLMFICFGLLTMVSAYDKFNTSIIPYMKEKIEEVQICHSQKTE